MSVSLFPLCLSLSIPLSPPLSPCLSVPHPKNSESVSSHSWQNVPLYSSLLYLSVPLPLSPCLSIYPSVPPCLPHLISSCNPLSEYVSLSDSLSLFLFVCLSPPPPTPLSHTHKPAIQAKPFVYYPGDILTHTILKLSTNMNTDVLDDTVTRVFSAINNVSLRPGKPAHETNI